MKERIYQFFEAVQKRRNEGNKDLLQCYFTSLMSLVLCVSMFLGTSYAWFTSEVTNVGNEIYIGILDVELEKEVGAEWRSLSETTGEGVNTTKLYDGGIRWEPGYTSLETVRVVNEGELAFNYMLQFTSGDVSKGTEQGQQLLAEENALTLEDVAQYFDVWVYDHKNGEMPVLTSIADINETTNWVNAGSLADVLEGKPILEGTMKREEIDAQEAAQTAALIEGQTETQTETENAVYENPGVHTYTIALHMSQDADATVMGHKISLNVKLIAYQMTDETDDLGNTYDSGIMAVTSLKGMNDVLNTSGNVLMTVDMEIGDTDSRVTMNGGVLDGNGKIINYAVTKADDEPSLGVVTTTGGIVRNLTIVDDAAAGRALYVTNLTSDLVVSNCDLSGAYSFNLNSSTASAYSVSFVKTTFRNWTSFANVTECVEFSYCTFEDTLRPYGSAKLTNCTFAEESLDLSMLEKGETVTLVNCLYGEKEIEYAKLSVDGSGNIQVERENGVTDNWNQPNP